MFEEFPKMGRLNREIVITEKIDGTNAQIWIEHESLIPDLPTREFFLARNADGLAILAGSRTRWVKPGKEDNAGWANWVATNATELFRLGPGRHFGEWWGKGIQRNYAQPQKNFSLFNTSRWGNPETRPACCDVVPILHTGNFDTNAIKGVLYELKRDGSKAAPGFMKPEGIVIFHTGTNSCFKVTLEHDEIPKSLIKE